jgi:hypothetical protein
MRYPPRNQRPDAAYPKRSSGCHESTGPTHNRGNQRDDELVFPATGRSKRAINSLPHFGAATAQRCDTVRARQETGGATILLASRERHAGRSTPSTVRHRIGPFSVKTASSIEADLSFERSGFNARAGCHINGAGAYERKRSGGCGEPTCPARDRGKQGNGPEVGLSACISREQPVSIGRGEGERSRARSRREINFVLVYRTEMTELRRLTRVGAGDSDDGGRTGWWAI